MERKTRTQNSFPSNLPNVSLPYSYNLMLDPEKPNDDYWSEVWINIFSWKAEDKLNTNEYKNPGTTLGVKGTTTEKF